MRCAFTTMPVVNEEADLPRRSAVNYSVAASNASHRAVALPASEQRRQPDAQSRRAPAAQNQTQIYDRRSGDGIVSPERWKQNSEDTHETLPRTAMRQRNVPAVPLCQLHPSPQQKSCRRDSRSFQA